MGVVRSNVTRPRRSVRPATRMIIDTTVNTGTINAGDLLYKTSNGKAASLNTAGALPATTTSAAIAATGYAHVALSQVSGIIVGMSLTIDTSTNAETVVVQEVDPSGISADFTKTHASGVAVTSTEDNTVNAIGVAITSNPLTFTSGVTGSQIPTGDPNLPTVEFLDDGDHLFATTAADSYYPYDPVYLGANAQTITKVANGAPIGYVSPDQSQSAGAATVPISTPIAGGTGVSIFVTIKPALSK